VRRVHSMQHLGGAPICLIEVPRYGSMHFINCGTKGLGAGARATQIGACDLNTHS
jgi:hypothetical protein